MHRLGFQLGLAATGCSDGLSDCITAAAAVARTEHSVQWTHIGSLRMVGPVRATSCCLCPVRMWTRIDMHVMLTTYLVAEEVQL